MLMMLMLYLNRIEQLYRASHAKTGLKLLSNNSK